MCSNCLSQKSFTASRNPYLGYPKGCCEFQDGYYCIWTLDHSAMECEEWVELCDFRNVLHTVSHITFNVVAERASARSALMNLKRIAPFGECKRFPWRKTFVNISCSVYSLLLQNILSSLDFKDRETEKEMKYGTGHKQDDKDQTSVSNSNLDDSKTRFRNTLIKIQNALCKKDEVYDRIKFEDKYQLQWCIGDCPTEPSIPDQPPNGPNLPENRTYGDMMRVLKSMGRTPADFSVFTEIDMKKNTFGCDRELQALGPSLANLKLPSQSLKVFIFSRAEYAECNDTDSEVQGFVYDKILNKIEGPVDLKKYGRLLEVEEDCPGLSDVTMNSDEWEEILKLVRLSLKGKGKSIGGDFVKKDNGERSSDEYEHV